MHDVIVVGGRCAGSPLGMLLARKGYRVLILDRDPLPSDMAMSTHLIHARGVACMARWGLREELAATSHPIGSAKSVAGPLTLAGSPPPVDKEAFAFAPRRSVLDAILFRAAEASGARIRDRHRVEELLFEDGHVVGVQGESESGSAFAEKARVVIGADGPSSRVAKAVGAEKYNTKPAIQTTAWIYWDGYLLDHFELHRGDYEAIYAYPSSHGCTLIGANWAMDRFKAIRGDVEGAYFELLRRVAPELADKVDGTRRADEKVYLGSTRNFFRRAHGPGWALVGDAFCKKDPCSAQGITDAFGDAEALAQAIDEAFGGSVELGAALAEYERTRVAWQMPFYEMTCETARFAPPSPEQRGLFQALQGNQDALNAFFGLLSEATLPQEFFSPDNIQRIMGAPPARSRR